MKPCPFCGSDDVGYSYGKHPDGHELSFIACGGCGAHGPVRNYDNEWDDDESAAAWDKRHNAKVSGAGTASAGLPGYTAGDNTE